MPFALLWGYGLLAYCPILILAFIGLIKARHFAPQTFIRGGILIGLAAHVLFVLTQTHNFSGDAYGGRYFIPVIPILYFFTAFILPPSLQTTSGKWLVAVAGVLSALIALFSAYQGVQATWHQVAPPFFGSLQEEASYLSLRSNLALPRPEPTLHRLGDHTFEIPPLSHRLDLDFNHEVTLLGYDLPRRRLQQEQTLDLKLYWQSRQVVPKSYFLFVQLVDTHQTRLGGFDRKLAEGYDFAYWYPGEIVVDPASLVLTPELPAGLVVADPVRLSLPSDLKAGTYSLVSGLYRPDTGERLPVPSSAENAIQLLTYSRE